MSLETGLRSLLACPLCHGALEDGAPRLELRCRRCGVAFPVVEGIPDLLPESARPLDLAPKSP
jgi:uncharacterized protein